MQAELCNSVYLLSDFPVQVFMISLPDSNILLPKADFQAV